MKNKVIIDLRIIGDFGSDFQQLTHTGSLITFLDGWREHVEKSHKKNKIEILIKRKVKKDGK